MQLRATHRHDHPHRERTAVLDAVYAEAEKAGTNSSRQRTSES